MRQLWGIAAVFLFWMGCATSPASRDDGDASSPASPTEEFDALWDYDRPENTEAAFLALLPRFSSENQPLLRAELLTQIARTHSLRGNFDEAHARLDEAKALIGDADAVAKVRLWLERGRCYNSAGDPTRARPKFLAAFRLALRLEVDAYAIDAAHMLAIVAEPEFSLEWNRLALEMAERSPSPNARKWKGSLYNNLGWTLFDRKQYAEALASFEKALAFREKAGKIKEIRIAKWCVARTLRALDKHAEALAMQQALVKEMEKAGETDGFVYEELAELHAAEGRLDASARDAARAYEELSKLSWFADSEPARLARLKELAGIPGK